MATRPHKSEQVSEEVGKVALAEIEASEASTEVDAPVLADDWRDMSEAPTNRAIRITRDPTEDPSGVLSFWRTTREKISGRKGWHTKSFWASVLTKRQLDFEPYCWREAVPGAALDAARAA